MRRRTVLILAILIGLLAAWQTAKALHARHCAGAGRGTCACGVDGCGE